MFRMSFFAGTTVSLLAAVPVTAQTLAVCDGFTPLNVSAGDSLPLPSGTTTLVLADQTGKPITTESKWSRAVTNAGVVLSSAEVSTLAAAVRPDPTKVSMRVERNPSTNTCRAQIVLKERATPAEPRGDAPVVPPPAPPTDTAFNTPHQQCQIEGDKEKARRRIGTQSRRGKPVVILFLDEEAKPEPQPCYIGEETVATGDELIVGVLTDGGTAWQGLAFEPCALEPAAPTIFQSETRQPTAPQAGLGLKVRWFGSRRCYNTSVNIRLGGTVPGEPPTPVSLTYLVEQYQRYRATIQTGVLFTPLQSPTFGLRPGTGDEKIIYNKGPSNRGPEYMAAIVFYGLPRYLEDLFGGEHYSGRDPVNEAGLLDRIGGVMGVGLTSPGRSFMLGGSLELLAGVNAVATRQFRRIDELADVEEGSTFSGTPEEIPIRSSWKNKWVFGISVDLRYITRLLASRTGT